MHDMETGFQPAKQHPPKFCSHKEASGLLPFFVSNQESPSSSSSSSLSSSPSSLPSPSLSPSSESLIVIYDEIPSFGHGHPPHFNGRFKKVLGFKSGLYFPAEKSSSRE
jgi:hypothetical protein